MKLNSIKIKYFFFMAIFVAISYLSLVVVYHFASDRSSFLSLGIFSFKMYVTAALLLIFNYAFDAARFYYILKAIHVNVSMKQIASLTLINYFTSNLTPFAVGGGVAQIYFLNREGIPVGAATAGTTIKTVLPLLFFMVSAPVILIFDRNLDRVLPNRSSFLYISIIVVLTVLAVIFLYRLLKDPVTFLNTAGRWVSRFHKRGKSSLRIENLSREVKGFRSHCALFFSGNKRDIFFSILMTLLFLLTLFLFPVLLIRDLNPAISVVAIILSQIVITFVMYFAPTPGSSGVAEAAFILLFSNYVSKGDLVSLTFSWRLFTMYIGMILGMAIFYILLFRAGNKKD